MSEKPPIEYPTHYPFKVMGKQEEDFSGWVRELFGRLFGAAIPDEAIAIQPSSKGTYVSVTVTLLLTSEAQRQQIYLGLQREKRIVYCL